MGDHMHGLCKNCLNKCTQTLQISKKENECVRCYEQEPSLIIEEDGVIAAICVKCYVKEQCSPKKTELKPSAMKQSTLFHSVVKNEMLNKSFFNNEGKMIRKIEKFFARFQGKVDDLLKELLKKSLVPVPMTWDKVSAKCDKTASLMYIFISKQLIVGCYHSEAIKIGDKSLVQDSQSGFFMTNRSKIQLQFFKPNYESVTYSNISKIISFGKPSCFDILLDNNEVKVRTEIVPLNTEWIYQFVYKL